MMPRWLRRSLLVVVGGPALVAAAITATYYVPVSIALGPCMKDWTSPYSYQSRVSKLITERFAVGSGHAQVCYGQPAARNRKVFGRLVPYDQLWRTGANEPTRFFTDVPLQVAGIPVPPGRYSLYTIPGEHEWTIAVNRSTFHWGLDLNEKVLAQDVGRAQVRSDSTATYVEWFTIRPAPDPEGARRVDLIIEWERTRVVIPLVPQ